MRLRFRGRCRGPASSSGRVGGGCHGPGRTSSLCPGKVGGRRVGGAGAVRSGEILDRDFVTTLQKCDGHSVKRRASS